MKFFYFLFFISCLQVAQPFFDLPFGDILPPKNIGTRRLDIGFFLKFFLKPKWLSSLGRFSQIDGYKPYMKYKLQSSFYFFGYTLKIRCKNF
jgi:hypothetical protein